MSGDTVSVIASSRTVEGKITEIGSDDGVVFAINSDGVTTDYKMNYLYEQLYNSNSDLEKPVLNDSAVFYLDNDGNIAASDKITDSESKAETAYGYLINAFIDNDKNRALTCRILTENNSIEDICAENRDKIKFGRMISGKYSTSTETASAILSVLYNGKKKVSRQMIKYETDNDGALKSIYLAGTSASGAEFTKDSEKSAKQYVNRILEKQYYIDQKTKVFEIANNGSDVEKSHVGAVAYYTSVTNYSLGTKGRSAIISKTNSPVMLIEKLKSVSDENGDEYTVAEGYENGVKVQRLIASNLSAKSDAMSRLKPGMLIQYETNNWETSKALTSKDAETIMVFRVLHDCNNINQDYYETWDYSTNVATNAAINIIYGEVNNAALPIISVYTNNSETAGTTELINVTEDTKILRYSVGRKTISPASRIEITDGMRLAVRRRNGNVRDVIIIEA